jgi:hypothetical protein
MAAATANSQDGHQAGYKAGHKEAHFPGGSRYLTGAVKVSRRYLFRDEVESYWFAQRNKPPVHGRVLTEEQQNEFWQRGRDADELERRRMEFYANNDSGTPVPADLKESNE